MKSFQTIIKYCALALACFLAVVIISGFAQMLSFVLSVVSSFDKDYGYETVEFEKEFTKVDNLDIENIVGTFKIKVGDAIRVEANNVSKSFKAEITSSGTLSISEKSNRTRFLWFDFNGRNSINSDITLYLPQEFVADHVRIDSGAGIVTIDAINCNTLTLNAGAGNINADHIKANKATIDGGVGAITLTDVHFSESMIDLGMGNLQMEGVLLGKNSINCGVGNISLDLKGNIEDYYFDIDSGIGKVTLNGQKVAGKINENQKNNNSIKLDGGLGNISIDINE